MKYKNTLILILLIIFFVKEDIVAIDSHVIKGAEESNSEVIKLLERAGQTDERAFADEIESLGGLKGVFIRPYFTQVQGPELRDALAKVIPGIVYEIWKKLPSNPNGEYYPQLAISIGTLKAETQAFRGGAVFTVVVETSLVQPVIIQRQDRTIKIKATTWRQISYGHYDAYAVYDKIIEVVKQQVDKFVSDFLIANPK